MTMLYTPTWHEPKLGEQAQDFDLCDITVPTRDGRKRYCGAQAVNAAMDVNGGTRLLCAYHVNLYFGGK